LRWGERKKSWRWCHCTLRPTLMAAKSPGALEVEQPYARARALCQPPGDTPQLFPTLRG
jgi:hypothetical protein